MSETFKERMKRLRLRAGLKSQLQAAEAIGCERGTVGMWEAPSSPVDSIGGDYLLPVARAYKVRPEYINSGKGGDGFPWSEPAGAGDTDWSDIIGVRQAAALGDGAEPDEYAETHKLKFRADSLRRKHLRPNKLAVIYGKGDSMYPTIKNGDAILVDTSDTEPQDEKLFVVTQGRDLFAKRLVRLGDRWFIDSDNKADPKWKRPMPIDEADGFEIHGRVRWVGSWED